MSSAGPGTSRWAFVALLTMTAIWGSTFFLIKDIVTRIPVPDLLALRFAIATIALTTMAAGRLKLSYPIVARGLALGLLYGTAQLLQTVGLAHTTASVSGFLTGLYVVATPMLAASILVDRRIFGSGGRRGHHGAADLGAGAGRAVSRCGDHGRGAGVGGRVRGRAGRRDDHRKDDHRWPGHRGGDVSGGAVAPTKSGTELRPRPGCTSILIFTSG